MKDQIKCTIFENREVQVSFDGEEITGKMTRHSNGMFKIEGVEIEVYHHDASTAAALFSDVVYCMAEGSLKVGDVH